MPTNKVIADKDTQIKNSPFNMSHDVNATASFGEVYPSFFQFLHQPSKTKVKVKTLSRMFPLVAPVFGRVSVRSEANFVSISEVFPKWKNILTNTQSLKLSTNAQQNDWQLEGDKIMPCISPLFLSWLVCCCCDFTRRTDLWSSNSASDPLKGIEVAPRPEAGNDGEFKVIFSPSTSVDVRSVLVSLMDNYKNQNINKVYPARAQFNYVTKNSSSSSYWLCGEMNKNGKRVRKILEGLGYIWTNQKGSDEIRMSLLPLLAWYKAYFTNYLLPLQNYFNWEDTSCYKLIESFSHESGVDSHGNLGTPNHLSFAACENWIDADGNNLMVRRLRLLIDFFKNELAYCIYTDNTIESACLNSNMNNYQVEPNPFYGLRSVTNALVGGYDELQLNAQGGFGALGVQQDTSTNTFSSFDNLTLMKLFTYVNRQTVRGAEIEKELIARGLSEFVDKCGNYYLGSSVNSVDITEVTSTTDTLNTETGDGVVQGNPAGRGVGGAFIDFDFSNKEPGFLFVMTTCVPESKGKQNLNMSLCQVDIQSWYNQLFDGVGYESIPTAFLSIIDGIVDRDDTENINSSFGIVPRYTGLKTKKNVLIGGFSDPNEMASYAPYSLDSYIFRNPLDFVQDLENQKLWLRWAIGVGNWDLNNSYKIPSAGVNWCRTLMSAYFGNFDRIFNERALPTFQKDSRHLRERNPHMSDYDIEEFGYMDSFINHHLVDCTVTTAMLPIAESYGCSTDETSSKVEL